VMMMDALFETVLLRMRRQ